MRRLIDADALRKKCVDLVHCIDAEAVKEDYYEGMAVGVQNAIVFIDVQPTIEAEPQWIPCSERLPEDDRSKVVTLANGNAEVGYYSNGDWWCVGESFRLENPTVIAWMPLPKPYEGDKE